jgi:hypothetical protein
MRLGPQDTAEMSPTKSPPRLSHPRQAAPSHQRCQQALLVPRAKRSMRLGPQETAEMLLKMVPPRFSKLPAGRKSVPPPFWYLW